ncbi:MAG: LLM class F420-dependent oxidoreductase [Acidimicrobiia bacterium]
MRLGISLPIYNTPLPALPALAGAADVAGFDSVWSYEVYANPFTILAASALATERIALGTGLAAATTRHPMLMANAIADVDEYSDGRAVLGIGAGSPLLTAAAGGNQTKPVSLLREYVGQLRRSWEILYRGEGGAYEGEFYASRIVPAGAGPRRTMVRPRIPIYVGAIRPTMIAAASESADGILGCFFTPEYTTDVVLPAMTRGAERGGRSVDDIDTILYLICSIDDDREEAYRRARIHVGSYVAFPGFVDPVLAHHGLTDQQQALQSALLTRGPSALSTMVGDDLVDLLSVSGTPDEVRDKVRALEGRVPHVLLHTPSVPPITAEESRDAFHAIVDTFGRSLG